MTWILDLELDSSYFVWFDSLRPDNNLSVMKVRVFLGWTSTKLGLMCLTQGHSTVMPMRLEPAAPRSRVKHSTTEPLRSLNIVHMTLYILSRKNYSKCQNILPWPLLRGAWWLSGRVLDLRSRGCGFEPHRRHCAESLGKTLYPLLSTGSTQEDPSQYDWKIVDRDVKD